MAPRKLTLSVPNSECVTLDNLRVTSRIGQNINLTHQIFGSFVAVHRKTLTNVDKVRMGDKARVTLALMPDKKTFYCVKASITSCNGVKRAIFKKTFHQRINSIYPLPADHRYQVMASCGLDANGTYVGIGTLVEQFVAVKNAAKRERRSKKRRMIDESLAPPAVTLKKESIEMENAEETTAMVKVERWSDSAINGKQEEQAHQRETTDKIDEKPEPNEEEQPKRSSSRALLGRVKAAILSSAEALQIMEKVDAELVTEIMQRVFTCLEWNKPCFTPLSHFICIILWVTVQMATITPSDDECISSKNFHVVKVDGTNVTLQHKVLGSVVAVMGENLNNVTTVCVKDCAHVTIALMPGMKTLYCVKASIARRVDGLLEKSTCATVHRVINIVDSYPAQMTKKLLESEGRDVVGNYVGIGRLIAMLVERQTAAWKEITTAPFCYDVENTDGVEENDPSSPPSIQTTHIVDTPPSKRPKLSTISPPIGMSPVVTVEEPIMTLEEKGGVSDREVIERMKSTIVSSAHMLHLLANVDTELLQVILQR